MIKIEARNILAKPGPINLWNKSESRKQPITTQALYFLYSIIPGGINADTLFFGLMI